MTADVRARSARVSGWRDLRSFARAAAAPVLMALAACAGPSPGSDPAPTARAVQPAPPAISSSVGFLVVGDTGYVTNPPGRSGLEPVMAAMHDYCQRASCRFGLMAGDNIYPDGAAGDAGDAELFRTRFTEPFARFTSLGSDFRFYAALGNHDWHTSRAGALAQVAFLRNHPPLHMNGLFYATQPPGLGGLVEVFAIDTEMLLAPLRLPDMKPAEGGGLVESGRMIRGGDANAEPANAAERAQLEWLETSLARSTAKWKLVFGHHPLWQSRPDDKHAQSVKLRQLLLPILCRHADAYFAGHQHTLEVATDSCSEGAAGAATLPLPNVLSGSGAKARDISMSYRAWLQHTYPQFRPLWAVGDQWGFAHVTLDGDRMNVRMLTVGTNGATTEGFAVSFPDRSNAAAADAAWIEERSITELQTELAAGRWTSERLVNAYLARIDAIDRAGPALSSIIATNPRALDQARALDAERRAGKVRGALHGIPILVKDNIETADPLPTTAGSLALKNNVTGRDASHIARLREAGAIVLAKTNLSEWANIRSSKSTSGWSAVGGLVRNPYALDRNACGSSSGSAVSTSASLGAASIGTETDGSIACPASMNGIVGFKPTVGLVSRRFVIPISGSQDTAGPMTRSVRDAAVMLSAIAGSDPGDAATREADQHKTNFAAALDENALRGVRLGVLRFAAGFSPEDDRVFEAALRTLTGAGAQLVEIREFPHRAEMGKNEFQVLLSEFKHGLNSYLASSPAPIPVRTLADLIAFNSAHADTELRYFGQETFIEAERTSGLDEPAYRTALATSRRLAGPEGLDKMLREHNVVALIAPTRGPAFMTNLADGDPDGPGSAGSLAAVAGYPHLTVPMGVVQGLPVGLSIIGPAWSDARVLALGHAFEKRSTARVRPAYAQSSTASH